VEPCEAEDRYEEEGDDDHDDDGDDRGDGLQLLRLLVVEDEDQAEDEDAGHVKRERYQEHEKVAVVPPTNAIVDPWAVMIKDLNAVVANRAVAAPGRAVELAGDAPLHPHRDPIDLNIAVEGSAEVIVSILVRTCARNHPGIHEGGHGEVDEDEKSDDSLEDWNSIPVLLQNVPLDTREIKEEGCGAQQKKPGKCGWEEFRLGFAFWHLGAALSLALLLLLLLHQIKDHT